jgi:hypothetical protein
MVGRGQPVAATLSQVSMLMSSAVSGFLHLLRWLSRNDFLEMLVQMRSNLHVCYGLDSKDLGYLLESSQRAAVNDPMVKGWTLFSTG